MIVLAIQQDGICIAYAMSNYLPRNSRQLDTDSKLEQFAALQRLRAQMYRQAAKDK